MHQRNKRRGIVISPMFQWRAAKREQSEFTGEKKKNRHLLADTYWRTSKWASARFRHRMALLQFLLTFERCIQVTSDKSECWKSSLNQDYCLQNITLKNIYIYFSFSKIEYLSSHFLGVHLACDELIKMNLDEHLFKMINCFERCFALLYFKEINI